ncbi:MAG: phosphonate ABC transporter, permease protein PhnE [Pseudomonadota bacterium]|nr:phosphonate ABC transporter, permease protein PhnE [Pseudomonadota bacterium]
MASETSNQNNKLDIVTQFEMARAQYLGRKRLYLVFFWLLFFVSMTLAVWHSGFDIMEVIEGLPRTNEFVVRMFSALTMENFKADLVDWYWNVGEWLNQLLISLQMALLATIVGTTFGGALSFLASRNLAKNYATYFVCRRALEIARTVPDIVWALIFIYPFGVGPVAGILALTIHTTGAQGKLFAEVNENIDHKPIEGIRSAGGNWFEEIRFAVMPQVMPNFISYSFWRLALNVQAATVMGFVGAGGIGYELINAIKLLYYLDAGAILLMIIITVFLIDMSSEKLRHKLIGKETLVGG